MSSPVEFCRDILPEVSRTFALNIPVLPSPLDEVVTIAYLLCRIADTVEDEAAVGVAERRALLAELARLSRLEKGFEERARAFEKNAARSLRPSAPPSEVKL